MTAATAIIPDDLTVSFQPIIGQPVTLRPLRPDDASIERDFLTGLSEHTRYNRLLGGAIRITEAYIRRLTELDWKHEVAFAAVTMLDDRELLIGVARYVVDAEGTGCEFAIVLGDAWQGRGVGRRMLEQLIVLARRRHLGCIYGDILSTNQPMLSLALRLGFRLARHPDDATVTRATLPL